MHRHRLLTVFFVSTLAACKEGDVDLGPFDGSIFDDEDAAAGRDANAAGEDAGVEDAGSAGDASAADAGDASAKPEDVPAVLARALCEAITDCRGALLTADYYNGEDCVARNRQRFEDGTFHFLPDSVAAGRASFAPDRLAACAAAVRALGCDVLSHRLPSECDAAVTGKVPLDGDCDIDFDCEGSAYCYKDAAGTCPGVCALPQSAGLPCTSTRECADGLVCFGASGSKTCAAPGVDGDDCSAGEPGCDLGFVCVDETSATVCRALDIVYDGMLGASCSPSDLCDSDLVCAAVSASAGSCEDPVTAGASCRRALPNQCPLGQYCDAASGAQGSCTALPGAGAACLTARSQVCAPGHVCLAATCEAMRRAGESCVDDAQCYSGTCFDTGSGRLCVTPASCDL